MLIVNCNKFIAEHKDDDVRQLALKKMPEGIDRKWVLQQIEGYQLARKKLPNWAAAFLSGLQEASPNGLQEASPHPTLHFPPRISLEQCSSEATAKYKRSIIEALHPDGHATFMDLTGGLGVDFSYMAQGFARAVYVEPSEELCALARHNLPLLGLPHAEVVNATCEEVLPPAPLQLPPEGGSDPSGREASARNFNPSILQSFNFPAGNDFHSSILQFFNFPAGNDFNSSILQSFNSSIFFLDPSRRSATGQRVCRIEECTPNLLDIQERLLEVADTVMVKLSPMLDITDTLRKLQGVSDVHVVSVRNECKELLFVMQGKAQRPTCGGDEGEAVPITLHCVNLDSGEPEFVCTAPLQLPPEWGRAVPISSAYLYEPNASILKAGVQDTFAARYGLSKIAPNSNLYVSDTPPPGALPARCFHIVGVSDFSKGSLKALLHDVERANIAVRNFPSDNGTRQNTVEALRRRLKLKDGGSEYLFATTQSDGRRILIRCHKQET